MVKQESERQLNTTKSATIPDDRSSSLAQSLQISRKTTSRVWPTSPKRCIHVSDNTGSRSRETSDDDSQLSEFLRIRLRQKRTRTSARRVSIDLPFKTRHWPQLESFAAALAPTHRTKTRTSQRPLLVCVRRHQTPQRQPRRSRPSDFSR